MKLCVFPVKLSVKTRLENPVRIPQKLKLFLNHNIMKKLCIIAGFVFATVFFASCESSDLMPQTNYSTSASLTKDFVEPEFATQKRPSLNAVENTLVPTETEIISVVENKLEQ